MNKTTLMKKIDLLKNQPCDKIDYIDILFDIEYFLKEYYYAKFYKNNNYLQVKLITGETFIITVIKGNNIKHKK